MSTILVVDDDPISRKALVAILSYEGHEILEATDGADGLNVARRHHPQLIISDVRMPTMDGHELVRHIRADQELATTAVIFYTASYHPREAQAAAAKCRVDRVITKPCSMRDFLVAVESVISTVTPPSP